MWEKKTEPIDDGVAGQETMNRRNDESRNPTYNVGEKTEPIGDGIAGQETMRNRRGGDGVAPAKKAL